MARIHSILMLFAAIFVSAAVSSVTNEEVTAYIKKHGHDPSLSPEEYLRKVQEEKQKTAQGAPKKIEEVKQAPNTHSQKEQRTISTEELYQHINKYGHDPNLSPEQIFQRIRSENP